MAIDLKHIRAQFPVLEREVNKKPLIYFDNAATTQKPLQVLSAMQKYFHQFNSNVHRGIHTLSQEATTMMEDAREKLQKFIGAQKAHEVIFTKGTTEGINLLTYSLTGLIGENDEIIISHLEHHSNIVPWQMLCERTGAKLKVIPMLASGALDMEAFYSLLSENTKMVAVNHISNALGVVNPVETIIQKAHQVGAWVMIDGAQSVPHLKIDVQELDADFYVFSGHKMYGPTGTGVLYGKEAILEKLPPFHGGGEMIKEVSFEKTTYAELPFKFEAGTPNISGNIVLGDAVDFMESIGIDNIANHENELVAYTKQKLSEFSEIEIYAKDSKTSGAVSFNLKQEGIHPSDIGMILDKQGIAIRTGHHCAQPIMSFLNIPGTARASFAVYNTKEEIDQFIDAIRLSVGMLV